MGPRRNLPGGAPSAQQLLEKRAADPEQGRQSPLGTPFAVIGLENFLS
jgi:hypothetical protein